MQSRPDLCYHRGMKVGRAHRHQQAHRQIKVGDLVSPKISAKFGSYGSTVHVLPEDHGIVTRILDDAEIECLFHNRPTWWHADELEVLQYA